MATNRLKYVGAGFAIAILLILIIGAAPPKYLPAPANALGALTNNGSGTLGWNNSLGGGGGDQVWTNDGTFIYPVAITSNILINSKGQIVVGSNAWQDINVNSLGPKTFTAISFVGDGDPNGRELYFNTIDSLASFFTNGEAQVRAAMTTSFLRLESFNGDKGRFWRLETGDEVTALFRFVGSYDGNDRLSFYPAATDGVQDAYTFDTVNTISSSKLLRVKNHGTDKFTVSGDGTIQAVGGMPTNAASFTTVAPANLHNIAIGKGWTNDLGQRADLVMSVKYTDAVTGDPALAFTNSITGEAWTNSFAFGIVGSMQELVTIPDISPNDRGSLTDRSGTGATVTILNAWWKLK